MKALNNKNFDINIFSLLFIKNVKRKFYEIEQDDGKASPTSNRVTKRAKLMNLSDRKFKNMKNTKSYIDKLTDLKAKKNVIEDEDKNSISDVEECSAIFKNKEKRATEATNKDIFENIKKEEIYIESEWCEEEEEELKFNLSIFDLFEEVSIRGDGNCMFRPLVLGGFVCENSYPLIREIIWDFIHTNSERFIPFITDGDLDNYLKNKMKNYWGEKKLLQSKNC